MQSSSFPFLCLPALLLMASSALPLSGDRPEPGQPIGNIVSFTIHFNINNDDKEHQDAVAVRFYNLQHQQVLLNEIVPPTDNNGPRNDPNKFYWPKDGPGKHEHVFTFTPPAPIPAAALNGYLFQVISGYTSGHGDFQSWNATINLDANLNTGASIAVKFCAQNGATTAVVSYHNGNPPPGGNQTWECKAYTY
jgi:hypothetical protein